MIKRITSVTTHETAEGTRGSFTYSLINDDGTLLKSNQRATVIILSDEILGHIKAIREFLTEKIPE